MKWRCTNHSGAPNDILPEETEVALLGNLCPKCGNAPKAKVPLVCNMCRLPWHDNCSNMKRYQVERAKTKGDWICLYCSNAEQPPETPQIPNTVHHKCYKNCKKSTINSRFKFLSCSKCSNTCHQIKDCSGISRDAVKQLIEKNSWVCDDCQYVRKDDPIPGSEDIEDVSERSGKGFLKRPLRILQWNADGISTKTTELAAFLSDNEIGVALIQESKLVKSSKTPFIDGYRPVRADRKNASHPGGGLITYINENIAFKNHGSTQIGIVETQSISIQQSVRSWLKFTNVYIPPGESDVDLSWIQTSKNTVLAGDWNGHTRLWDESQPEDKRGDKMLDWIILNNLSCLNDGTGTRINRGTGNENAPGVSLVHPDLVPK